MKGRDLRSWATKLRSSIYMVHMALIRGWVTCLYVVEVMEVMGADGS
jgi:hypothetical protein